MTALCESTTPLASRFDSTLLNVSSDVFKEIDDYTRLVDLNANPIERLDRQTVVDLTNKTNNLLDNIDISDYNTLSDRHSQGPLTFVEIADFIVSNNQDIDGIFSAVGEWSPAVMGDNLSAPIDSYLGDLDYYLNTNLGKSISSGLCGAFTNIFAQLGGLFTLISTAQELIADIKNLAEKDPVKLAKSLTLTAVLKKIKDTVLEIVDKVIAQLMKQVQGVIDSVVGMAGELKCAAQSAFNHIQQAADQIKEFFDEVNKDGLKKSLEKFMAKMVAQFERLTAENVALMMFRFCQLTEIIQSLLTAPVDGIKKLASALTIEQAALKSAGLVETKKAVEAGALRISTDEREKAIAAANEKINEEAPSLAEVADGASGNFECPTCPNKEEMEQVAALDENGIPGKFTFEPQVINQNDFEGKYLKGAGYKKVQKDVYYKLLRTIAQTGTEVKINSAYRSAGKNASVGGASLSKHMTGDAIDVRVTGDYKKRAEFVVAASRAGFKGIGVYSTFIHLDIAGRRAWVAGEPQTPSDYPVPSSQTDRWVELVSRHDRDKLRSV